MANVFQLLTTLTLVIIAVVYLNNAFLQVDNANRKGCVSPYTDANGTIQNCTLSNKDFQQINNTESTYAITTGGIGITMPILAIIVLVAGFIYLIKVRK